MNDIFTAMKPPLIIFTFLQCYLLFFQTRLTVSPTTEDACHSYFKHQEMDTTCLNGQCHVRVRQGLV